jgi:hypothetical protein
MVMDQEALGQGFLLHAPRELARLLRHPRRRWAARATSNVDSPTAKFDKKEDIEGF